MGGDYKKFDEKSIMRDYVDEFIRKMRMTGLISLRGAGRFIDINHNEDEKVEYVLGHYSTYPSFTDEREYFDYMSAIDSNLFAIRAVEVSDTKSEELLNNWVAEYSWETIKHEITILSRRRSSADDVLRILAAPFVWNFLQLLLLSLGSRMSV